GRATRQRGAHEPFENAARLRAVRRRSDVETHRRIGQAKLLEEHLGQSSVVVLAGVDDGDVELGARAKPPVQRRDLHEIRARAGDEVDAFHGRLRGGARCSATPHNTANRAALPGICRLKSTIAWSAIAEIPVKAPTRSQYPLVLVSSAKRRRTASTNTPM